MFPAAPQLAVPARPKVPARTVSHLASEGGPPTVAALGEAGREVRLLVKLPILGAKQAQKVSGTDLLGHAKYCQRCESL